MHSEYLDYLEHQFAQDQRRARNKRAQARSSEKKIDAESLQRAARLLKPTSNSGPLFGGTTADIEIASAIISSGGREMSFAARTAKRYVDFLMALFLLVMLMPVLWLIAILIRVESPGPVLFSQRRIGYLGRPFSMVKFRTMRAGGPFSLASISDGFSNDGPLFKLNNDLRVTRIGAFLRKYSLDELPQLLNVVSGQMSIVGPRPRLPQEVHRYNQRQRGHFLVRPGITGIWQIAGPDMITWEAALALDSYYVKNWSAVLDIMILWRTVQTLAGRNPAVREPD